MQESRTMAHLALTRAILQPAATAATAATAAMHCDTHPPPLVPPFLLAQNLSSKWIAPTDNMRPNFDDDYCIALNFRGCLISRILRIFNRSQNYFNEIFLIRKLQFSQARASMDNIPGLCCQIHKGRSPRDTFEVGVALTAASSSTDDCVSAY